MTISTGPAVAWQSRLCFHIAAACGSGMANATDILYLDFSTLNAFHVPLSRHYVVDFYFKISDGEMEMMEP